MLRNVYIQWFDCGQGVQCIYSVYRHCIHTNVYIVYNVNVYNVYSCMYIVPTMYIHMYCMYCNVLALHNVYKVFFCMYTVLL